MDCGEFLSYWGSWASLIGIPLTIAGLLLTKSVKDTIVASRFNRRLTKIVSEIRNAQRGGNPTALAQEIEVLVHAFETSFSWYELRFSTRISKAYKEAKKQSKEPAPNITVLDGLLTNFKTLHAEVNP